MHTIRETSSTHAASTPAPTAIPLPRDASPSIRLTTVAATSGATVIVVAGEVDLQTAPRLAELLEPRLLADPHTLVIDLTAVTFLGAFGLRVLMRAQRRSRAAGGGLRVITGPRCVNRVLEITGLSAELACHPARMAG